jgi:hypothetical protein
LNDISYADAKSLGPAILLQGNKKSYSMNAISLVVLFGHQQQLDNPEFDFIVPILYC